MTDLVCLQEFSSRMEAELARGILEANEISAPGFADGGGGSFNGVLFSSGVARLMVLQLDLEQARQLLDELKS